MQTALIRRQRLDLIHIHWVEIGNNLVIFGDIGINCVFLTFSHPNNLRRVDRENALGDYIRSTALDKGLVCGSVDGMTTENPVGCINQLVSKAITSTDICRLR